VKNVNQLLQQWPTGAVLSQPWLTAHGVSSVAAGRWAREGWLARVGHGAYRRAGDKVNWQGGLYGLQQPHGEGPAFWLGGLSALELSEGSHFLRFGEEALTLWGEPGRRLPRWFAGYDWDVRVSYQQYALFDRAPADSIQSYTPPGRDFDIQVATPERAVLEWFYALSGEAFFGSLVSETFGGLVTLRPRRLQVLLEACRSVKVKRAFLLLARHYGHAWYRRLDTGRIDLGAGKRQLYPGGRLDRDFQVTVPREWGDDV
jgi:hypothetical protein